MPPSGILQRTEIKSLSEIIAGVKRDVEELARFRTDRCEATLSAPCSEPLRELAYCDLSGAPFDVLREYVSSMGIKLIEYSEDDLKTVEEHILVNCVGIPPQRLACKVRRESQKLLIVADADRVEKYRDYGEAICLPTSYQRLQSFCWRATRRATTSQPFAEATVWV